MILFTEDYPSDLLKADASSNKAQRIYKGIYIGILALLFAATIVVCINDNLVERFTYWHSISGVLFIIGGCSSTLLYFIKPEMKWYLGRAVSESIKTLTWKFMMRAQPFNSYSDKKDKELFLDRIRQIVVKPGENSFDINSPAIHEQCITKKMNEVRLLPVTDRKSIYTDSRLDDQIQWYKKKAGVNKRRSRNIMWSIIILQFLTAVYLIFFSNTFHSVNLPEVTIYIVTALIAVMEMNKYKELKESYSYTHRELLYIRHRVGLINNELELDEFVNDAELAISREHTMWLARRVN